MLENIESTNFAVFRDCFSSSILQRVKRYKEATPKRASGRAGKGRKNVVKLGTSQLDDDINKQNSNDGEELADFIEYLASEIFATLPAELKQLSYSALQKDPQISEKYLNRGYHSDLPPIPTTVTESLSTYALLPPTTDNSVLISSIISDYIVATTSPPPIWSNTRASACEICERDWIPLTYHHLIPKQVHEKALKRGWHDKWKLDTVAWLCRACHSFVHRFAANEVLAREMYSVELLMDREEVRAWAGWVGRVRWKAK